MRQAKRSGLTGSAFVRPGPDEPVEITATGHGIDVVVFFQGETTARTVKFRPVHIKAVAAMKDDWWGSRWAAVHEAEA